MERATAETEEQWGSGERGGGKEISGVEETSVRGRRGQVQSVE